MGISSDDIIEHAANAALRRRWEPRLRPGLQPVLSPAEVERPHETLGTHPDLVARLWDELGQGLAAGCKIVFYGGPALIHPVTGVVFGFAEGTHAYALRLPEPERLAALTAGAPRVHHYPREPAFGLDDIGAEWVFGFWHRDEAAWCRAAYEAAGAATQF